MVRFISMARLFVDHIVLFVKDVKRSRDFYSKFLKAPLHKDPHSVCYQIGETKLFLALPYRKPRRKFEKEELGLNHLAFGIRTLSELRGIETRLNKVRIKNSGVQIDRYGKKPFIWFDDPDGMRLEFYLRK